MKHILFAILGVLLLTSVATAEFLVLDDPLQTATTGFQVGGTFTGSGFRVDTENDGIYWHLPYVIRNGYCQFTASGLDGTCSNNKMEILHAYDYTRGSPDTVKADYDTNIYKMYLRRNRDNNNIWTCGVINGYFLDSEGISISWSGSHTWKFEWISPTGSLTINIYKDGGPVDTKTISAAGEYWNPAGMSVRIGASPRNDAIIGATYSNFQVYDTSSSPPVPAAPDVFWPVANGSVRTTTPFVAWIGDSHTAYQVRINSADDPDLGIIWDSGNVSSSRNDVTAGALSDHSDYYVFVRLRNDIGWGDWSSIGHRFRVNTSHVWPRHGPARVSGYCLEDDGGKFLGLGATYMQALRRCKYDRDRFRRDVAYLSSQGVRYIRILSMVGYYAVWQGMEIAPISFYNQNGVFVPGWPDYWQQFRDMLDIAYGEFGVRCEVTIFADAQLMPADADRRAHMDGILANVAGREHEVAYLEVANEYFKNGFPDPAGPAVIREYGQYLTDRTGIPVALSTPHGNTDNLLIAMYSGGTADLATQHFTRDCTTIEGGWLPVRDPWRVYGLPGVPPVSNDEPIGPGSSGTSQTDEIKLVSGAAFSWIAKLPCYVFHSDAGTRYDTRFEEKPGLSKYHNMLELLPADLPNWTRNDGLEASAPFTVYCMGQANKYWPDIPGATNGVHRNVGSVKLNQFVCYPMGILAGGLTLQARRPVTFTVYNPLTGDTVIGPVSKNAGDQFTLTQGPQAYVLKGTLDDVPPPAEATISQAKSLADGETRTLKGMTVSAVFDDCFYVQQPNGYYGIKIAPALSVVAGDSVDVFGELSGSGAERWLDITGNAIKITHPGPGVPSPVIMSASSCGGAGLNAWSPGVTGGLGPNNIGLYVTVYGKVTAVGSGFFYFDDGSGVTDPRIDPATGNPYIGVKILVVSGNPFPETLGEYWKSTGIVSLEVDGANLIRVVRATSAIRLQ